MDSFIDKQIRRMNRNLLITNLFIFPFVAILSWRFVTTSNERFLLGLVYGVVPSVLTLWNLQNAVRRFAHPELHPSFKALKQYGNPVDIAASIQDEFRSSDQVVRLKKCFLSSSWLVIPDVFNIDFVRLDDIVWIYRLQTKKTINGIPSDTTHKAVIVKRNGNIETIESAKSGVNDAMEMIYSRVPWIHVGYSAELQNVFSSDRDKFIAIVESRRREMTQQAGNRTL